MNDTNLTGEEIEQRMDELARLYAETHDVEVAPRRRYFSRPCPRCGSFFGLVLRQASSQPRVLSVDGLCITCRYGINWALVRGRALAIKVHKKRLPIRAGPKTL